MGSDVEESNNGCVVALECSAGKCCVLASAWRSDWHLSPSGQPLGDVMERRTNNSIEKKRTGRIREGQPEESDGPRLLPDTLDLLMISSAPSPNHSPHSRSQFACLGLWDVRSSPPLRTRSGQSEAACGRFRSSWRHHESGCCTNNSKQASRGRCFYHSSDWIRTDLSTLASSWNSRLMQS